MPSSAGSNLSGADWVSAGQPPQQSPDLIYHEALRGALILLRANGGEIATLDTAREVLLSRSRQIYPRLDQAQGQAAPTSRPRREPAAPFSDIESQPTHVLPSPHGSAPYRLGEGLIGYVAQRGTPLIVNADQYREQFRGARDLEGQWYLAVPIFRPGDLSLLRSDQGVLGAIVVYNRDPHWPFTPRDIELLALHADRLARRMMDEELRRSIQIQGVLIDLLRGTEERDADISAIYQRVRHAVDRTIQPPSFALISLDETGTEATFEIAERDGMPAQGRSMKASDLPAWWRHWVAKGKTIRRGGLDEFKMYHDEFTLGWGSDAPAQSIIATPLTHRARIIGALVIGSPHPNAFSDEQQGALEAIARTTAAVLETTRLAEQNRRSLERLAALNSALQGLNTTLDLQATADTLAGFAIQITGAAAATIFLRDVETKTFVARSIQPANVTSLPLQEIVIPEDWRYLRNLPLSEETLLQDNVESAWSADTGIGRFLSEQQIRSFLIVPIISRDVPSGGSQGKVVGLLFVYTPGQPAPFQHISRNSGQVQALAAQAGIAINNALLYEDLVSALERQKELDRLKDEFILTISHEFRTPLTAIEGYGSLLSKHGDRLDVVKATRFADEIHRATIQLNGMISMLSDANRLSTQDLEVTIKPARVLDAIEQALYNQGPQARERIVVEAPGDLGVLANPERLSTVFSNLLSNALKYAEHGPITVLAYGESQAALVRAGRLTSERAAAGERWVVMVVQDTGPGIPREEQDKLFQKFVRLPRSLTTAVRGTGLGLWICAEYIHAMGGKIWVESEMGQGARFLFCLPAAALNARQ
jgi:signal transduction histidine kinase